MDLAGRTVIYTLESCNVDHNKAFMKGALCSVVLNLPMLILEQESEIRDSFESTTIQGAISQMVVSKMAKKAVTDPAMLATIAKFAVEAVTNGVAESARESAAMTSRLPAQSGSDSSSDEEKKYRETKS